MGKQVTRTCTRVVRVSLSPPPATTTHLGGRHEREVREQHQRAGVGRGGDARLLRLDQLVAAHPQHLHRGRDERERHEGVSF